MNWLQFASSVIGSTASPLAAVVIAVIFRRQISMLLQRMKDASWGGARVNFTEELDVIEQETLLLSRIETPRRSALCVLNDERFSQLLSISPSAAVMDAWSQVERRLFARAGGFGIKYLDPKVPIEKRLADSELLNNTAISIIQGMRKLRNSAAHSESVTAADALRFKSYADVLDQEIKRQFEP